jgi:pimeloyl-ACP methyl ester carboxylesterase
METPMESTSPFRVEVDASILDDLQRRLCNTRWTRVTPGADWEFGTDPAYLRELVEYWKTSYDWRAHEARLNAFAQFKARVDGIELHFVHERGRGEAPLPLVLTHGFPDSFFRFAKLIPLLTDPTAHGGDARDAFDVVVPSMPGYAFSEKPAKDGIIFHVGGLWHRLMTGVLGYRRFGAHGGDWGSFVTEQLARSHEASVVGVHLTDMPFWHAFRKPGDTSPAEDRYLKQIEEFQKSEGAYAMIQGSRPQTLADALNDSPAGLASWIVEKFRRWSDCGGDVEKRFTKDELLTNVMIYWVTETIGSSLLPYYDVTHAGAMRWMAEMAKQWVGSSKVPAAFAMHPKDLSHPPREWVQRFFNVRRWTEMPSGGHFAAMEEPERLADDIRAFFRPLRKER